MSIREVNTTDKEYGVWKAIGVGHLWVTVPGIIIFFALFFSVRSLLGTTGNQIVPAFCGLVAGWLWYAAMAPRWRVWALAKGAPVEKLRSLAILTGLTWGRDGDKPRK